MFLCMRTTIRLEDNLLKAAKKRAVELDTTLTAVIEDALRTALAKPTQAKRPKKTDLPVSGSGGLCPGVDLDDTSSLFDIMENR